MTSKKKASFVIPSHNAAAWLPSAVESCRQQTHKNVEIIVVDDGSTDSTPRYFDYLDGLEDDRIKLIRLPKCVGRSSARNTGNEAAAGDVIFVLDADDLAYPKRAELTLEQFDKGAQFLYASAVEFTAIGDKIQDVIADAFDKEKALETLHNRIVHSTVAYTKQISKDFQYRNGEISELGIDDWAHQIELAMAGVKLDFIPNIVTAYRRLTTAITMTRKRDDVDAAKRRFLDSLKIQA